MNLPSIRDDAGDDALEWANDQAIPLLKKLRRLRANDIRVLQVAASITLTTDDLCISYEGDGNHTITLPAADAGFGQTISISHNGTGANGLLRVVPPTGATVSRTTACWMGPGDLVTFVSNGAGKWTASESSQNTSYRVRSYEEFIRSTNAMNAYGDLFFSITGAGANIGITSPITAGDADRIGILTCSTGTTATGVVAGMGTNSTVFGFAPIYVRGDVCIPTLSDGTERFFVRMGLSNFISTEPTDGAYFRYKDDENGGRWQGVIRIGAVETMIDLGVAVTTSFTRLEVIVGTAAAQFYIDGILRGTATSVPGTTALTGWHGIGIEKTVGITSRSVRIDVGEFIVWPVAR